MKTLILTLTGCLGLVILSGCAGDDRPATTTTTTEESVVQPASSTTTTVQSAP
ncbi:MAG: hypothetical protein WDO13_21750 [Verrucomicrobiota bacterium]